MQIEQWTGKTSKTQRPFKTPFFYGWVIVVLSALTLFFSGPGQTYSVSVFIDSYINDFGWSRSLVSTMYSMGTLLAGICMSLVGGLFDKKGHRKMTAVVAVVFGAALIWMSMVRSLVMLFMGFFFIRLLGQGSLTLSSSTLVPQWFVKRRGRALSLVSLGGALSAAVLPPVNAWMINTYGWRIGWRFWALMLWLVMVPIGLFFTRNRPEEIGLTVDNEDKSDNVAHKNPKLIDLEDSWTVKDAMRTRSFWLLLFCFTIPSAVGTGMTFHLVSIMAEANLSLEVAAMVLSIQAIVRLPILPIAGFLADKLPSRYIVAGIQTILLLSVVVVLLTRSFYVALIYGVLRGINLSFQSIIGSAIWPDYYGRGHLGSIRGVAMMGMVIGSAFGPLPFGIAFDLFGGYTQILVLSAIIPAVGIVAALMAKPPVKRVRSKPISV